MRNRVDPRRLDALEELVPLTTGGAYRRRRSLATA
jgi:hypothetical protein